MISKARDEFVRKYAWALPSDQAIELLRGLRPLVEMGAGTGYWASLIGGDIICYDINVPEITYWPVAIGDPRSLGTEQRTLFLCWPPYNTPMAYDSLCYYKGKTVIYIGEGNGGCTGCDLFHEKLRKDFTCVKELAIPQWENIHDYLTVWQRDSV